MALYFGHPTMLIHRPVVIQRHVYMPTNTVGTIVTTSPISPYVSNQPIQTNSSVPVNTDYTPVTRGRWQRDRTYADGTRDRWIGYFKGSEFFATDKVYDRR